MISIITPVLNEEINIAPFFNHLKTIEGGFELILVDGGSTDSTLKKIGSLKAGLKHKVIVLTSERGRGAQMNRGAAAASGSIFLFLHVDSVIEKDSLKIIENTLKRNDIVGGGFTHEFSGNDKYLKALCVMGNMRVKMTKIFYGDYAIFIKRTVFEQMGGYDTLKILEDVEFCKKAKNHGKLVQIRSLTVTSPRRFQKIGKFKLTTIFLLAVFYNMFGKRPDFLVKFIAE